MWIGYTQLLQNQEVPDFHYTHHAHAVTQTHTKVISMKLYSLRPRSAAECWNEILSTCFYVYAKLLYLSHIYPRCILFLIYQFQFLSPCHSRKAEDIFGCCHSSPREPEPCLLFLFRLPKKHSLVTPLLKTKDASGINNIESIFFFFETSLLDFSTWFHPVIEASGFFFLGKIFFLFLKHQSSLKKQQVLSQETDNNNFLYIWRTGFLYFFSSYFTIPSQLYFLEPEPLWLCLCQFLL